MTQPDLIRTTFLAYLTTQNVPHSVQGAMVCVHDSLWIKPGANVALPEAMVIEGSLDIHDTEYTCLPERLSVRDDLLLDHTAITALPAVLCVGRDILAAHSALATLPENLHVFRDLDIKASQITHLPEGLVVEGDLNFRKTQVARLPTHMLVRGDIEPSGSLLDIIAYMDTQAGDVVVSLGTSHHARMSAMHDLKDFPDLRTVMESLRLGVDLRLIKGRHSKVFPELFWR
ncbi:MAG: hypothetical protein ACRYGG_12510 [Janthinobacterium lividum]